MKPVSTLIILHAFLIGFVMASGQDLYARLCNDVESINEKTDRKLRKAQKAIASLRTECICAFNNDVDTLLKEIAKIRNGCFCPAPESTPAPTTTSTPAPTPVKTSTAGPAPSCPEGWSLFQGTCYSFHDDVPMNWEAAQGKCQELGGNLASAETEEIHNFIAEQAYRRDYGPWLGGKIIEGSWVWEKNGESLVYENWDPHHMEFKEGECIFLYRFGEDPVRWRNISCLGRLMDFVCEKPASV